MESGGTENDPEPKLLPFPGVFGVLAVFPSHRLVTLVGLVACVAGCKATPAPVPIEAGAGVDAGLTPAAADLLRNGPRPSLPGDTPPQAERAVLACRIIAVEGRVSADAAPGGGLIALDAPLPPGWISLGNPSRLVAKDPRTSRETTFVGPGRVRDCVGHAEEAWVSQGVFDSTAGAGEAPGAEEWIVTPQGVVRYGAAKLRVGVRPAGTTVTMVAGVAFLWPPNAALRLDASPIDEGWQRLAAGDTLAPPSGTATLAVERCSALAARAHDLTAALFSGGDRDGAPTVDGAAVTAQVTARRLARAACAIAEVQVGTSAPDGPLRADAAQTPWATKLAEADAAWRALPITEVLR